MLKSGEQKKAYAFINGECKIWEGFLLRKAGEGYTKVGRFENKTVMKEKLVKLGDNGEV